ncbi:MAG: hypothetical protein J7M14_05095 [Planctomycetes bacterium]|nr:hypothetical protein [Planctomycetota bacterium]
MDDTTAQHRDKKVYGKGCHHDSAGFSRTRIVRRWGHRWVVPAIWVKFPFTSRFKRTTIAVVINFALALTRWLIVPSVAAMAVQAMRVRDSSLEFVVAPNPIVQAVVLTEGATGIRPESSH